MTLLVVGAGPKAASIIAKAKVLKDIEYNVPLIEIVEKNEVASYWSGRFGLTDGQQSLGTPPDKDVGFPYNSICWEADCKTVNHRMLRYSWHSYQVSLASYESWVDRGRPAPTHQEWASYLKWVFAECQSSEKGERVYNLTIAEVQEIGLEHDLWKLKLKNSSGTSTVEGSGLVITGPGPTKAPGDLNDPALVDAYDFWGKATQYKEKGMAVAVIGTGETAASIVVGLYQLLGPKSTIDIISPTGLIYSRGESFAENMFYSNPEGLGWRQLSKEHRKDFIDRTDRGVFSIQAMDILRRKGQFQVKGGRVEDIKRSGDFLNLHAQKEKLSGNYDLVIQAMGFNPLWFVNLLTEPAKTVLSASVGIPVTDGKDTGDLIASRIGHDLSVENFNPKLHLPMTAGLEQGPGFPNLSCLGLTSDRILRSCVPTKTAIPTPPSAETG